MRHTMYKIVEIFHSIEGEGKRAGATATFIRLAGCNLRCTYCDTAYSQEERYCEEMSLDEIMSHCLYPRITITGGEPLLAAGIEILVDRLLSDDFEVNIETNGSVDISPLPLGTDKLFLTMDYKLPSSGEMEAMFLPNFEKLRTYDVLKFVVGSENDVQCMLDFLQKLHIKPQIYIGTVYGKFSLKALAEIILREPILKDACLQLQFHKIIWDANTRGV